MTTKKTRRAVLSAALAASAFAGTFAGPSEQRANAQEKTFHLDRLEIPGSPDDGVTLFLPDENPRNIFYGQLALGYQLRPLRTRDITQDPSALGRTTNTGVIQDQLTIYGNVGFEILERVTIGVSFPWSPEQDGNNPNYGTGNVQGPGQNATTPFKTGGPTAGDMRFDLRATYYRSPDRTLQLGGQISVFAPTGTQTDFGSDNGAGVLFNLTAEKTIKWISLAANLGYYIRPEHRVNDPVDESGLGIGNEVRFGIGAFVPLKDGKYRVGASIFGSTGGQPSDSLIGDTFFRKENTPLEWNVEGRMRLGPADHWWIGASGGTRFIVDAYGAPDMRLLAMVGAYIPILDSEAKSPERRAENRQKWRDAHVRDRDHDGIPDDIDACPDEPEDHLGNDPNDGCPMPADRDGDGIPDMYDKCPDVPEDKDGIDDGDGCPEDDADNDGIPDVVDACPKVPGQKNADPKKNGCPTFIAVEGNVVRILQQVHFATGSATILPESFPMLGEISSLLKANKGIKRMSIDGHTDNRGAAEMNKKLSGDRAASVLTYLTQHGVEPGRLESHGYGLERPIEPNDTDAGRAANRRVEFKILDEEDANQIKK